MNLSRWGIVTALAAAFVISAPTAGVAGTASAPPRLHTAGPGGPMLAASGKSSTETFSENWSGYAATSRKAFNYAHSTFVQPAITCTGRPNQWTSNWVGLDGFDSGTVEQDGTFAHCAGPDNETAVYKAWYELYPAPSVNVFSVNPGDIIDTSVKYSNGEFSLTVTDLTTGRTAADTASCADCARSSAEWIVERPALCNNAETKCFLTELADFDTATMGGDQAAVDGGTTKAVSGFNNYAIDMVDPLASGGFISLDTVGPVSRKTFTATWDRPGSTQPIQLD